MVDLLIECCETEAVSRCRDTTCCEVYIVGAVKQVLFRCRVLMGFQTKCFCRGGQAGGSVRAVQADNGDPAGIVLRYAIDVLINTGLTKGDKQIFCVIPAAQESLLFRWPASKDY